MTSKTDKATNKYHTYIYNPENKLTQYRLYDSPGSTTPITTALYKYDGLGRRTEKIINGSLTRYVYDGNAIVQELDGSNVLKASYIHGPRIDEPLAMERDGSWYYYHADGLGSITALTDTAGNVVEKYYYDTFGRIVIKDANNNTLQQSAIGNSYTYTSREYDAESGLYFYRARYYDSSTGRFINKDPAGMVDGPNLYTYCKNNPIINIDLKGTDAIVLNDSNGALGFGHIGIAIGNFKDGWDYYSKDGYGNNDYRHYDSYGEMIADIGDRYDRRHYIYTSEKQTEEMNEYAKETITDPYALTNNNCADFVDEVLDSGELNTGTSSEENAVSIPNNLFDYVEENNPSGLPEVK